MGPKKFQKVVLTVSPRGLSLQDAETKETIENVSIYRYGARKKRVNPGGEYSITEARVGWELSRSFS